MKKKTLSLALALAVCLGLTVPAFAANPATLTDGGISVTLSDVLFEEDVTIHFNDYGEEYDETVHIYRTPEEIRGHRNQQWQADSKLFIRNKQLAVDAGERSLDGEGQHWH